MNTNIASDDVSPEQWLAATPALPSAVCARLKKAGIAAYWFPTDHWGSGALRGRLLIHSTFSKLHIVKQILAESGVRRTNWPTPPRWRRRPESCHFRLVIKHETPEPAVPRNITLRPTLEQRLKLEHYAQRTGLTLHGAVQALLDRALRDDHNHPANVT